MWKDSFLNRQFHLHLLQTTISNYMEPYFSYTIATFHLLCNPLTPPLYLSSFGNYFWRKVLLVNLTDAKPNHYRLSSAAVSHVYAHAYFNHRYTVFPSKLKLKKHAIRVPWCLFSLCFCLICFPYIHDHILAVFPGDSESHFPCMLSPTLKYYHSQVQQGGRSIRGTHKQTPRNSMTTHFYCWSQ